MEKSRIEGRRWIRQPEDVAIRVRVENLRSGLSVGIVVDPGVTALFLEDGQVREKVGPGSYTLETLLERLAFWRPGKVLDLVLVARGPHPLSFGFDEVLSKDDQLVRVDLELSFEVVNPRQLATALLPGPGELSRADLTGRLRPGVRRATEGEVGRQTVAQRPDRVRLASGIAAAAEPFAVRFGFATPTADAVAIHTPDLDALREKRGQDAIQSAHAERLEQRADSLRRLRDVLRSEKAEGIRDERALEQILAEADRGRLIEKATRERLEAALVEDARGLERLREVAEEEHQRAQEAARRAHGREETGKDVDAKIRQQLRVTEAERQVRSEDHQQDVQEALDGVRVLEAMKRSKAELRREDASFDLDLDGRRQELEQSAQERAQQRELERLRALDGMSHQALVAAAKDPSQAALIEQLARLEHARELSPEQLLALVAGSSGDAAAALAKRFESGSASEKEALYERMLAMQNESHQRSQELSAELARTAMESHSAVAREASRRVPERVDATPGAGNPCAACRHSLPGGARFCPACGTPTAG